MVKTYSIHNQDGCGSLANPVVFPKVDGANVATAVFVFDRLNISSDVIVQNAFLKFVPAEDSTGDLVTYSIALLYTSLEQVPCEDVTNVSYHELALPASWNISGQWTKDVPVATVDIAKLINFMIRKSTWKSDSPIQIILHPLTEEASAVTRRIKANLTELVLNYEDRYASMYNSRPVTI